MENAEEIMGKCSHSLKEQTSRLILAFLVQKLIEITHKRAHPGTL